MMELLYDKIIEMDKILIVLPTVLKDILQQILTAINGSGGVAEMIAFRER